MSAEPLWSPSDEQRARANLTRFTAQVRGEHRSAAAIDDYDALYRWSIDHPEQFWESVWGWGDVIADRRADGRAWDEVLVGRERMAPPDPVAGPRWFTGARLNFAENLLRHADDAPAIIAWNEGGAARRLTYRELGAEVARVANALRAHGIAPGDRVAALMPNIPETVVAMLAATSLGAIWSSCSPDFGADGVVDRFGQIAPRILFTVDGYRYAGKRIPLGARVREIAERIPAIERIVVLPYLASAAPSSVGSSTAGEDLAPGAVWFDDWAGQAASSTAAPRFTRLPFDHPLYIMYSSGTTGLPKCMVHGAGGTLVQHIKELSLHCDVRRDDRVFYFSTCGWMMWNWLVSNLAIGAAIVLYDGAPFIGDRPILWDMAEQERITVFGTSAKWLGLAEKEGQRPRESHDLAALASILSTGSPLAPHSFDYVYRDVKADVRLSSISGGTDIISCFAGGNPLAPVYRGELQSLALGMRVEVYDDVGRPVVGEAGELVCTMPFPSMPIAFWNDADGSKYRAAYFETYPNVWRHGDWAELTEHGGMIIHGRSDATLNPGGVRIGTAEIYRQVEQLPEIVESVVVGQTLPGATDGDVRIVLFARLAEGVVLDEALRDRIRARIRANTSPHHVPRKIIAVPDIPRTISGKITEIAVRDVIHGRAVKNVDALANPAALEYFRDRAELRD